tara:strand:+ start:1096 stop:2274 length:1179 start_codon:yes stop_codon:yes gene_type:complete
MTRKYKKDKMDRLIELDRLLQNRRGYTFKELKNKLDLGEDSNDPIRKMFGYENGLVEGIRHGKDWPEYLEKKYKYHYQNGTIIEKFKVSYDNKFRFRYAEKDFSLFSNELTQYVVDSIIPVLEKLNQIHGISNIYINELEELSDVINNQRKGEYKKKIEKIESGRKIIRSDALKVFSLGLDDEIYEKDDYTPNIYKSINEKVVLKIKYKPPNIKPTKIICHPYLIAESNDRWYLIAYVEEALEKDSIFIKNDRIGKINLLETSRIIDEPQNLKNEYMEKIQLDELHNIIDDSIGVKLFSKEDYHNSWEQPKREELKLKLDRELVFYFKTRPLIGGPEEKINEKNIYTRPNTIVTADLKRKILSYGRQIKVIKPTVLRTQIEKEIKEMTKNYN